MLEKQQDGEYSSEISFKSNQLPIIDVKNNAVYESNHSLGTFEMQ